MNEHGRRLGWTAFLKVALWLIAVPVWAATITVPGDYGTIEAAVGAATAGDTIEVAEGTYAPVGGRLVIDKSLTLRADPALGIEGPAPAARPRVELDYFSWSNCAVQIGADGVVVDGLELVNSGWDTGGYIIGDYDSARNGWTVRNCAIHAGRQGVRILGNDVVIEGNDIYDTRGDCIDCEYGPCLGLTVTGNWLHSHHTDSGKKPAGITYQCTDEVGGTVEITYNYCWACRTMVDFQNDGTAGAPANYSVVVAHNTADWGLAALPENPSGGDVAQQMSLAWWTGAGGWDASHFIVRDNLFTRQKWYAVVDTDLAMVGQVELENCLFFQWYLASDWYPDYAYSNEWPAARGAVGWEDMGAGNGFVMNGCLTQDPLYAATGVRPDSYYALRHTGSPAYLAATDGTNIGAWQGVPPPRPTSVWADAGWQSQTDVDLFDPGLTWQFDAFGSINTALDTVAAGGTVNMRAGNYAESLNIDKPVTLRGDAAGDPPVVVLPDEDAAGVRVAADNVTLEYLHLTKAYQDGYSNCILEIPRGGAWDAYTIEYDGIVLRDVIFDGGRRGAFITAADLTIDGCQFYDQSRDCLYFNGLAGTTLISGNTFVGDVNSKKALLFENFSSADPAISGTVLVTDNYCVGKRNFLVYGQWLHPAQQLDLQVLHNTLDAVGSKVISFYAAYVDNPDAFTQKFSSILIQDNIISNSGPAVFVDYEDWGGAPAPDLRPVPAAGQIVIDNNLFFGNAGDPDTETLDVTGNFGFYDVVGATPAGADLTMFGTNANVVGLPRFVGSGTTMPELYELAIGSPAHLAASDGTNIGAWQGTPTVKCPAVLVVADAASEAAGAMTLSAVLTDGLTGDPLAGETVNFQIDGAGVGSAVTDGTGTAVFAGTAPGTAGTYEVRAEFAGNLMYAAAADTGTLEVGGTTLAAEDVAGVTGGTVQLRATLTETVGGAPIPLATVAFTVDGNAAGSAVTDTSGVATLLYPVTEANGQYAVAATYAGDATWQAAVAAAELTVTGHGSVTSLTVETLTPTVTADDTATFTATASDGTNTWDATAETVFSISAGAAGSWAGNVYTTALVGAWTVRGAYEGITATTGLTVTHGVAIGLAATPGMATVDEGAPQTYSATATDSDGNSWDVSTDPATAWDDNGADGDFDVAGAGANVYTAGSAGTVTVKATYGGLTSNACTLTVNPVPAQAGNVLTWDAAKQQLVFGNTPVTADGWYTLADGTAQVYIDVTVSLGWTKGEIEQYDATGGSGDGDEVPVTAPNYIKFKQYSSYLAQESSVNGVRKLARYYECFNLTKVYDGGWSNKIGAWELLLSFEGPAQIDHYAQEFTP